MAGTVTRYRPECYPMGHTIVLRTEEQLKPGTSGGPVVTEDAHLLGVISVSSGDLKESIPVAHLALPKWVLERMAWTGPDAEEVDRVPHHGETPPAHKDYWLSWRAVGLELGIAPNGPGGLPPSPKTEIVFRMAISRYVANRRHC